MKLKNKDVFTGVLEISKFSERNIPIKVSYAVGKSLVRLREQKEVIDNCVSKAQQAHAVNDLGGKQAEKDGVLQWDDLPGLVTEIGELQEEECDIDVHSLTADKFMELMESKTCKECGHVANGEVSSDEMAALIKLGIVGD